MLRRSPDDTDPLERVVVANADQMVIVCALADPAPRTPVHRPVPGRRLRRGPRPAARADQVRPGVAAQGPRVLPAARHPHADHPAAAARADHGPAAQGARRPDQRADRPVGSRQVDAGQRAGAGRGPGGRPGQRGDRASGRHTSSSAIALPLPDDSGWLIDTPGVRGFGLGHVTVERVVEAFGDLAEGTAACPPGCDHLSAGLRPRRVGGRARRRGPPRLAAPPAPQPRVRRRVLADRDGAAGTPVGAVRRPRHQVLVDQVAPERGVVVVQSP